MHVLHRIVSTCPQDLPASSYWPHRYFVALGTLSSPRALPLPPFPPRWPSVPVPSPPSPLALKECGGSYVKLLTHVNGFKPEDLVDSTPYSIMFGE